MSSTSISYPNSQELKDVINESVKQTELLGFLRNKGIFYLNASHEDSSMLTARLLLDGDDLNDIRRYAYRNVNKSLLSGFTLESNSIFDLESVYNAIREKETFKEEGYKLKALYKVGGRSKEFGGSVEYRRYRLGKTAFLKEEKHEISFRIKELSKKQWQVEVDGESSSDGKAIQKLFSMAVRGKDITMDELRLDGLSNAKTITFFDRLVKEGLDGEWAIEDILRLTLRRSKDKNEQVEEIEEETESVGEIEESKDVEIKEAPQEQLSGISQAILEGKNLRENKFVRMAEEDGYLFASMTYMFERKNDNSHIKIRAEFKGNPKIFEVSLESFSKPDTDLSEGDTVDLSDEQNYQFRTMFWNNAKKIYNEISTGKAE